LNLIIHLKILSIAQVGYLNPMQTPRAAGLCPTLRQLMILVLAVATLCAALISSYRNGFLGNKPDIVCLNLAFVIGVWAVPWLMFLLFMFDRRGHVRNWYIGQLMAGGGLLTAAAFLMVDPVSWALTGRKTLVFPLLPITGAVCLISTMFAMRAVRPGRCLFCGRRSVIGVASRFGPTRIRHDTGWCVTCGADYERENMGEWKTSA
jgi:hypothetical protein